MTRRRGRVIPFPARPGTPAPDDRSLVEVHRCEQPEALVVKSLLESHGIPTVLRSPLAQSVHPFTVGDQGTLVMLVSKENAAAALRLLR
jgi:hypothetical protein